MQEFMVGQKKKKWSGLGIEIDGVVSPNNWSYTTGTHLNSDGSYNFDGANEVDYIRISYQNTPYPIGEDMEIRINAKIEQIFDNTKPIYFVGKWYGGTDGALYDWVAQRRTDGLLYFTIASLGTSAIATTATVPIGVDFEIYWRRRGDQMYAEFNKTACFSRTVAVQRNANIDWMIGTYLNAALDGSSANATRAKWKLNGLKINRL